MLTCYRWVNYPTKKETCSLWRTRTQWEAEEPPGELSAPSRTVKHTRAASTLNLLTSTVKWLKLNSMASAKMCLTFSVTFWFQTQKWPRLKCSTWRCVVTTIATYVSSPQVICKWEIQLYRVYYFQSWETVCSDHFSFDDLGANKWSRMPRIVTEKLSPSQKTWSQHTQSA